MAGHARVKAAKEAGLDSVPAVYLDLEGDQALAYMVADNRLQQETDWDVPLMQEIVAELQEHKYDVTLTGLKAAELEDLFSNVYDQDLIEDNMDMDEELKNIKEPVTKQGDVWKLGRHRLYCGDATDPNSYTVLMEGEKADLCITDPPYNVDYQGKTSESLKIKNDKMGADTFYQFLLDAYRCIYDNLADGAGIYVFHADTEGLSFRSAFKEAGYHLANVCIWVKQAFVLGRCDYHWKHEPILYGWKPTGKHRWYGNRKQTTVWEFDRPIKSLDHPTMKPVALCAYPMRNSSKAKGIVLDPFGGSGSTLMACEQMDRICRTMELDERYCDVIVRRYIRQCGSEDVALCRDGQIVPMKEYQDKLT